MKRSRYRNFRKELGVLKYSVIINCYNTLPLIKSCLDAALETTNPNTELILINNHPPYSDAQRYLATFQHPRVRILDPGKNIGCMPGFQLGAESAKGEYIVKLDDDVIVPQKNWIEVMHRALKDHPDLAYVALQPAAIKSAPTKPVVCKGYTLEYHDDTIIFWCMMIPRRLWRTKYMMRNLPLYGVGERYYNQITHELGLRKAYLASHVCTSLGRTKESDPLYGAWKLFYAKQKENRADFPQWQKNFQLGSEETQIMRDFGYPDDQIAEIKSLLKRIQS